MSAEMLYQLINFSVVPAWALLILLPKSAITRTIVHSGIYPLALGTFYIAVFAYSLMSGTLSGGNFATAAGISEMFQSPFGVLIGWSHYLVFDLFVGAWIARDGIRRQSHWGWVAPCLLLTFVLGPIGLLSYIILRAIIRKCGIGLWEDASASSPPA